METKTSDMNNQITARAEPKVKGVGTRRFLKLVFFKKHTISYPPNFSHIT